MTTIITPVTGGAAVVPLGSPARGHHTVRARTLAGEAGQHRGAWATADLYLPPFVPPDATLHLDFEQWLAYAEPAGLGRGGVISTPDAALAVSRPSSRGRRNPAGAFETIGNNVIAGDHDDAGAPRGLQIEPQATYARVNSLMTGLVVGSPGTAPDGWSIPAPAGLTRTLSLVTTSGRPKLRVHYAGAPANNIQILLQTIPALTLAAASGQIWTYGARFSCGGTGIDGNSLALNHWETDGSNNILRSGAVGGTSPLAHTRRSTTVTLGAGIAYLRLLLGSGIITAGTTCDFWIEVEAPQLTQTPYLPSEMLVGTSTAVRFADGISLALGSWFNPLVGTLLAEVVIPYALGTATYAGLASISDGTLANRATLAHYHATGLAADGVISGNVGQAVFNTGPVYVAGAVRRHALAWAADDVQNAVDGVLSALDAVAALPVGMARLDIGALTAAANNPLNGWIRRLTYWPYRMPGAEMQARTAA